ncbi:hypothetical protein [Billgrantia montanilacus]|uniref:hypothetical protein n=1 Tax=Billgrantia montanilacus TaxID=2282305 RepID=UPI0011C01C33|nr:hypothetical protein [Halomonas montanilacus]
MERDSFQACISLHPYNRRLQVKLGGTLLDDTSCVIELRERGAAPVPAASGTTLVVFSMEGQSC